MSDERPTADPLSMDYPQFVAQWCLGQEPRMGDDAQHLLATVARVAPGLYRQLTDGQSWGPGVVAPFVELGAVINATQVMTGSAPVLKRMAAGDRAARSELRVARFLAERGMTVELEPELAGRRPDFRIVSPSLVFGEVVTPEDSEPIKALSTAIATALAALIEGTPWGGRLEVVMSGEGDPRQVAKWLVAHMPDVITNLAAIDVPLAGAAFSLTQIDPAVGPQVGRTLDLPGPAIFRATSQTRDGGARCALLRVSVTDERAGRILEAEAKHFTRDYPTLVILDTGRGPFKASVWGPLIERRFQPRINTRFSAVGFFQRNFYADMKYGTDWSLLQNPYAERPIPPPVADMFYREP